MRREEQALTLLVPYTAADVLALIYRNCRVLSSDATSEGLTLQVQGTGATISRIRRRLELTQS